MIMMQQPSVVFNAHDVKPTYYKMLFTIDLQKGATAFEIVSKIKALHYIHPLRNIIFNCHGYEGKVSIGGHGQYGIQASTVGAFAALKSLNIGTIWLTSCDAAQGNGGKFLCMLLSQAAGTQVIAGDADQGPSPWEAFRLWTTATGQIDDIAGNVFSFTPAGGMRAISNLESVWTVKT